ncbi:FmdB family zinc ribbon protein [bacterium]
MPLYDYECTKCGHIFEVEHGINDSTNRRCPECRCKANKIFSAVGIMFKGSGFYCNDSRNSKTAVTPPCGDKECATEKKETGACPAKSEDSETCSTCK